MGKDDHIFGAGTAAATDSAERAGEADERHLGDGEVTEATAENGRQPVHDGAESAIVLWEHPTKRRVLEDVKLTFRGVEDEEKAIAGYPGDAVIEKEFFDFSFLEEYEIVEWRWVNAPFAFVAILYDPDEREYHYRVVEPTLSWFEEYVKQDLVSSLRNSLMYRDLTKGDEDVEAVFKQEARGIIAEHAATVSDGSLHKLQYYLLRDFLHFGPIDPIMRDPPVEDVSCDGHDLPVFVYHREYRDLPTNVVFGREKLDSFVFRLSQRAGKQLTVSSPLVDATLPNGSRIQLTLGGDVSTRGSNFTIRKFAEVPFTPVDLIDKGTFSAEQMAYFWLAIENNRSLIFAGGTGSGKTSSMNAISFFIPPNSKIVSIEDTREVDLPHQNWIQSVTRTGVSSQGQGEVSMYRLLQAALRQRPEYIIVGEIRTEERVALTFFQALSTGHTAYTTFHADSPRTVLHRLNNKPLNVPTQMLQDLDIIAIQKQTFLDDERVRRTDVIAEIVPGQESLDRVETVDIFERDAHTDSFEQVADSTVLEEIAETWGWDERELQAQLDNRRAVLEYLLENDITQYTDVAAAVQLFHRKPEFIMDMIRTGSLTARDLRAEVDLDELTPEDLGLTDELEALR
jgi:flagellar protein FlaI